MFSSRTDWNLDENNLSRLARDLRAHGEPILDLTESNPTQCGFLAPSWLLETLGGSSNLFYEPNPKGLFETRAAIARYYLETGTSTNSGAIVVTASTSEAYSWMFRLLCNREDEILVPRPGYPLFEVLSSLSDVRLVPYDLRYDGEWHIDLESIRAGISDRTRALVLVTPNNPTGSFLKIPEWRAIEKIAAEHRCAVLSDEVFSPFGFASDNRRAPSLADSANVLTFTLNGLSKLAGLPQMKLAWIAVSGPDHLRIPALNRLEMISDTFLSVSTSIQHAVPLILQDRRAFSDPILERVSGNHAALRSGIRPSAGVSVLNGEGGWSAVLQVPATRSDEDWSVALLEKMHVLVHPGHFFDCSAGTYLIVSLLPARALFDEGIRRIGDFIASQ